jgi:ribosomal protein S21
MLVFKYSITFFEMPKTQSINPSKKQFFNEPSTPKKRKSLTAAQKQEVFLKKNLHLS